MRKPELEVLRHTVSAGISAVVARVRIPWARVRGEIAGGVPPLEISKRVLAFLPGLPIDPGGLLSGAGDLLGKGLDLVIPKKPPLPVGYVSENELTNCTPVCLGTIPAGASAKLSVSNNGTLPFDSSGYVEVLSIPPIDVPPGVTQTPRITGNNDMTLDGPRTIWVHLNGEEDACDVTITVFPKQGV